jgi:hypothetical protein
VREKRTAHNFWPIILVINPELAYFIYKYYVSQGDDMKVFSTIPKKQPKGLAMFEVLLAVAVALIAIVAFMHIQSGTANKSADDQSASDVTILINKAVARTFDLFDAGDDYYIGDQENCVINFTTYEMECAGDRGQQGPVLNVSTDYLQQLERQGVQSYEVVISIEGSEY